MTLPALLPLSVGFADGLASGGERFDGLYARLNPCMSSHASFELARNP